MLRYCLYALHDLCSHHIRVPRTQALTKQKDIGVENILYILLLNVIIGPMLAFGKTGSLYRRWRRQALQVLGSDGRQVVNFTVDLTDDPLHCLIQQYHNMGALKIEQVCYYLTCLPLLAF